MEELGGGEAFAQMWDSTLLTPLKSSFAITKGYIFSIFFCVPNSAKTRNWNCAQYGDRFTHPTIIKASVCDGYVVLIKYFNIDYRAVANIFSTTTCKGQRDL